MKDTKHRYMEVTDGDESPTGINRGRGRSPIQPSQKAPAAQLTLTPVAQGQLQASNQKSEVILHKNEPKYFDDGLKQALNEKFAKSKPMLADHL